MEEKNPGSRWRVDCRVSRANVKLEFVWFHGLLRAPEKLVL